MRESPNSVKFERPCGRPCSLIGCQRVLSNQRAWPPTDSHGLPHGLSNFTENLTFDSNSTSDSVESDVLIKQMLINYRLQHGSTASNMNTL